LARSYSHQELQERNERAIEEMKKVQAQVVQQIQELRNRGKE
jgi:hypothetical protein